MGTHDGIPWEFPRSAVHPRDARGLARWDSGAYRGIYAAKHAIALELQPGSILEIGVRAGYSALAFLSACPKARYVGLDAENGRHGGQGGPWTPWAKGLLEPYSAEIAVVDTQESDSLTRLWARRTADFPLPIQVLVFGPFDLIHVDGDHSEAGCLHDLRLSLPALAQDGAILVDDMNLGGVRRAVDRFTEENGLLAEPRPVRSALLSDRDNFQTPRV